MTKTLEQIQVPTEEILKDILDTQKEIDNLRDEKEILQRNPLENKTRIYLVQGNIYKRVEFVDKLKGILEIRNKQKTT